MLSSVNTLHHEKLLILKSALEALLGEAIAAFTITRNEACMVIKRPHLEPIIRQLRDHRLLSFRQLIDICGVDYPTRPERFEVVYHFLNMSHNLRLRLKVAVPDGGSLPTCSHLYSAANWYEREIWDMYGIPFDDHPDLRRLLTDYDFEGFPLRKDFPLSGYTQVRYDEKKAAVIQEPVALMQPYREFDFLTPWEGPRHPLPGDEKASTEGAP